MESTISVVQNQMTYIGLVQWMMDLLMANLLAVFLQQVLLNKIKNCRKRSRKKISITYWLIRRQMLFRIDFLNKQVDIDISLDHPLQYKFQYCNNLCRISCIRRLLGLVWWQQEPVQQWQSVLVFHNVYQSCLLCTCMSGDQSKQRLLYRCHRPNSKEEDILQYEVNFKCTEHP